MKALWFNFYLAFRNIIRQKRRSAISVSAITFGVIALILASGFIEWLLMDFRESTIQSQLGHLQIVRPGYHDIGRSDPHAFLLPDSIPELSDKNEKVKQIIKVVPRLSFSGLISYQESTLSFVADGVGSLKQIGLGNIMESSSDKNQLAINSNDIRIGKGLAHNLGVAAGDQIILLANTTSGGINAVEIKIDSLFSTTSKSYDDVALRVPIETAQKLLRTQGSHAWIIFLNDTAQTDTVLAELRNSLPQDKFEIVPWYKLADFYNKTVELFTRQINVIKFIIVLIILLSISNTMTISMVERIGEIGTAMALGVNRASILRLFLSEGIILGCFGGLAGLIISIFLAHAISIVGIPMPPPPGMTQGYTGEILITRNIVFESIILAVGATLIASILPAWNASKMQIVDALRHNR